MAKKMFVGIKGNSYARIDARSDESGTHVWMLEINPNPQMFTPHAPEGGDWIL